MWVYVLIFLSVFPSSLSSLFLYLNDHQREGPPYKPFTVSFCCVWVFPACSGLGFLWSTSRQSWLNKHGINNDELSWMSDHRSFWALLSQTSVKNLWDIVRMGMSWGSAEGASRTSHIRFELVCLRVFTLLHLGLDRHVNFKPLRSDLLTTQRWETYHAFWLNLRFS